MALEDITRPASFDPDKDYGRVLARGDHQLGDYDVNDLQAIVHHGLEETFGVLLREGAVLREGGGTIAAPEVGVAVGGTALGSTGTYVGGLSQLYTVRIVAGGAGGTATYTWDSTAGDVPPVAGTTLVIRAIAPDLDTGLADLATYGHAVGALGVIVVFVNASGAVAAGASWTINASHASELPTVAGTDITIPDFLIYVAGKVHRARGATLTYAAASSGVSVVYAEWTRTVVTHLDDPDLTDPSTGTAQAQRERWRVIVTSVNNSAAPVGATLLERRVFPVYLWHRDTDIVERVSEQPYAIPLEKTEGTLPARRVTGFDQSETLRGLLARRSDGAHGSFVITPKRHSIRASIAAATPSPGAVRITVAPLYAIVQGVEVRREDALDVEIPVGTATGQVIGETHSYFAENDPILLDKAGGEPAFTIDAVTRLVAEQIVGTIDVGGYEAVVRGAGSADSVANTPLLEIIRISNTQGGAADYSEGVEYQLTAGQIEWIVAPPAAPAGGVTYYAVYRYRRTMAQPADFSLQSDGAVTFTLLPPDGTIFEVDYTYFQPRTDVIGIRLNGALDVVRGLPGEQPQVPRIPDFVLPFVQVEIRGADDVRLKSFRNNALHFDELNEMLESFDELTINVARMQLDQQAIARAPGSLLDIFTDAFTTTVNADPGFDINEVAYDALIAPLVPEVTLPFANEIVELSQVVGPGGGQVDAREGAFFWTLPYTHELAIDASPFSQGYPINPYSDFTPPAPDFLLNPSIDLWPYTPPVQSTIARKIEDEVRLALQPRSNRVARADVAFADAFNPTQVEGGLVSITMRSIPVEIRGEHFVPGERIRMRFANKVDVELTPKGTTTAGPNSFTVVSEPTVGDELGGKLECEFTVPPGIHYGAALVELFGDGGLGGAWPGGYTLRATRTFVSRPEARDVATETVAVVTANDPIAQSFSFEETRMVSRLDLPIRQKPTLAEAIAQPFANVIVAELRATDRAGLGSTPSRQRLDSTVFQRNIVNVGPTSSNVWTLAEPVIMPANEFRALVLRCFHKKWQVYIAQIGAPDQSGSGGFISQPTISPGIFMDSSNNFDWTLRQAFDLKCKVYTLLADGPTAYVYFTPAPAADITGFYLSADQVIPEGTSILWQYSRDGLPITTPGKVWTSFLPFSVVEFPAIATQVDVRAVLQTTDLHVTPSIHKGNVALVLHKNQGEYTYVSRRHVLTQPTANLRGSVELRMPAGATVAVSVSVDDGLTWQQVSLFNPQSATLGFVQWDFTATVTTPGNRLRVQIKAVTPDASQRPRGRKLICFAEPTPT